MLRVAIVDDHEIVRVGLREMLADELAIEIAFEAGSGEEALERLRDCSCDVLLLDLALPGQSGIDVLRTVRQRHADIKVLVLTGYPEQRYAKTMIQNGAAGYLCKECGRDQLLQAVHALGNGRRYLSPRMTELLADEIAGQGTSAAPPTALRTRTAGLPATRPGRVGIGYRQVTEPQRQDGQQLSLALAREDRRGEQCRTRDLCAAQWLDRRVTRPGAAFRRRRRPRLPPGGRHCDGFRHCPLGVVCLLDCHRS